MELSMFTITQGLPEFLFWEKLQADAGIILQDTSRRQVAVLFPGVHVWLTPSLATLSLHACPHLGAQEM